MSQAARARLSERMRTANPMQRAEIAAKVAASTRGTQRPKSAEGLEAIATAARARMLSAANPMKNPAVHQAAMAKQLARTTSKNEAHFRDWALGLGLPVTHQGDGSLWVGRRNPDFRVTGQHKVIEVTQSACFNNGLRVRTIEGYANPTIAHYESKKWRCLVVFKRDHRCAIPSALARVTEDFASPDSNWSGVWHFDRLIRFDESAAESGSTTSPAHP
jgi:hypothetical protein